MSDETLDEATAMYRILRLRRIRRERSADGPGSRTWVWMIAGAALAAMMIAGFILRCARRGMVVDARAPDA